MTPADGSTGNIVSNDNRACLVRGSYPFRSSKRTLSRLVQLITSANSVI